MNKLNLLPKNSTKQLGTVHQILTETSGNECSAMKKPTCKLMKPLKMSFAILPIKQFMTLKKLHTFNSSSNFMIQWQESQQN